MLFLPNNQSFFLLQSILLKASYYTIRRNSHLKMQTSQELQSSASMQSFYQKPGQGFDFDPYCSSSFQILHNNQSPDISSQGINLSFQTCQDQYITLESSSVASDLMQYDSPLSSTSGLTNRSPFSTQASSHSYLSDPHQSCDQYGSPMSASSVVNDEYEQRHRMIREVELFLLGPDSETGGDSCNCCSLTSGVHQLDPVTRNQIMEIIPRLDLKELLELCAKAFTESNTQMAMELMLELEKRVSVCGDPIQRVGAYMLEGLRARLGSSGSLIYKRLKCTELSVPTSADLMSFMGVLFTICPFWKFAYRSANIIIQEAMEYEPRIHIIDFQIAQGTQWVGLMEAIATRARAQGRPLPSIRVTGVDDSQSALARGGGLELVGQKLRATAESWGFQFEFHNAAMDGSDVELHNLGLHHGEAIAVNFPYVLHHMSDESVSTDNHRDRLLRLVKSLSPKVMTLVEQESNTNTSPFLFRFRETLDYYTAMFESIDAGSSNVESKKRINAEQQCIARDIVNMIACEGADRVERHELFRKWQLRLQFAGFEQCRLSGQVVDGVRALLKDYHKNYRIEEKDGALYLGWVNRAMVTCSAWR